MYNYPIGVIVESFPGRTEESIKKAAAIGAQGIQMYMTAYGLPENHVDNMTTERQKMLLDMVKSEGMVFSAICGDLGGDAGMRGGFQYKENNAKKIEKSDCLLDFSEDAYNVWCRIRGLSPIPLSFAYLNGKMVKFISAEYSDKSHNKAVGEVISLDGGKIEIACGKGSILLTRLLPEGKGRMDALGFINGRRVAVGDIFKQTKE